MILSGGMCFLSGGGLSDTFADFAPAWYERAEPITILGNSAADDRVSLVLPLGSVVVGGVQVVRTSVGEIDINDSGNWDDAQYATAANRAGKDFYIYALSSRGVVLSANATVPTGYTAATSRKIGGFHCLCLSVGTISGHTLTGFVTGDILPQSVWDLKHRPVSSPEGMVCLPESGLWVDIYLMSGAGENSESAFGATITDTRNWMDFVDDLGAVGKRLLNDHEFQLAAAGSNEETAINGAADPVTTGGHTDTAGRRMVSNYGLEDCAGALWQWLLDQSYRDSGTIDFSWIDLDDPLGDSNYDGGSKGSLYVQSAYGDVKLLAGGAWGYGSSCGSRCRYAANARWAASSVIGGRGCAWSQAT